MPAVVRADEVLVGLVTETNPTMIAQAIRLVRSLRWFGGAVGEARVMVCSVGELPADARGIFESLKAEIRTVSRFHPANPTANRLQLLSELLDAPQRLLLMLDCDTLITRDPLPLLRDDVFQAKPAPTPTVSDEVFDCLFAHFGIVKPPHSVVAAFSGDRMIPYFNAGVIAIPTTLARTLAPVWRRLNQELADRPELVAPCERHMHQASLALALAETGIPWACLPEEMNFQTNGGQVNAPEEIKRIDPVIIHYHHLATEDGFLLPSRYPGAQARIDLFHERMRAEGFTPAETRTDAGESRPIGVLGMHRSGTSLVAQLLAESGVYAGRPDELIAPDMFNPTGYWEHRDVVAIDDEILGELGGDWFDTFAADSSQLSEAKRSSFIARMRKIVERSLKGRGPFLLKDPRMSVLFPLWREALENPVCVIAWRDPMAIANSIARRDGRPHLLSIAAWEQSMRTLLRTTEGLPRVSVSYEELLADPVRVLDRLLGFLAESGIEGLTLPSKERLSQIVNSDFNRSGSGLKAEETLLDESQRALVDGLRSGDALRAPVAPLSPRTSSVIAAFKGYDDVRKDVVDRDQLLRAVFESGSWRIGYRLTGLLRLFRRKKSLTVIDRWNDLQERKS